MKDGLERLLEAQQEGRPSQRGGFCHEEGTDVCGPIKSAVVKQRWSDRQNAPTFARRNNSRLESKT